MRRRSLKTSGFICRQPGRSPRWLRYICLWLLTLLICVGVIPLRRFVAIALPPGTPISSDSTSVPAETLAQHGQALYQSGEYAEAAQAFLHAAKRYQQEGNPIQRAIALSNQALAYQQLGAWDAANEAISESLALLNQPTANSGDQARRLGQWAQAQVFDIQGHLLLAQGNSEAAISAWETAAQIFHALDHDDRAMESQVNRAQALQTLGLHRQAVTLLAELLNLDRAITTAPSPETLLAQWQNLPQWAATLPALQNLGEGLRVIGDLPLARQVLEQSLELARAREDAAAIANTQFNLAALTRTEAYAILSNTTLTPTKANELVMLNAQGDRRHGIQDAERFVTTMNQALDHYRQADSSGLSRLSVIQTQLNQLRILIELWRGDEAHRLIQQIWPLLDQLPPSRDAIYARINLAQSLIKLESEQIISTSDRTPEPMTTAYLLSVAVQQAHHLGDIRAESYALGNLGSLYENYQQLEDAQRVTNQALLLAQSHQAHDIAYRWQWQLGRILKTQAEKLNDLTSNESDQKRQEAIAAYTAAVDTLKSIRSDLVAITPEEQFSFRDTIEPIYRQLVTLLLTSTPLPNQPTLKAARDVIESLQLAELDNFFRQACLTAEPSFVDQIDHTAAVFYPVVLPDRLAVIISLPSQSGESGTPILTYFTVSVDRSQVESTVDLLRDALDQPNDSRFLTPAQQLYDWLIRPVSDQLDPSRVKTLVFVLDDILRDVPVSVLHNGQQYLVERPYSLALAPGLQLLEPQASNGHSQSVLLAGITEAQEGFSPLPNVRNELQRIQSVFPRTTTLLDNIHLRRSNLEVDGEFTRDNFSVVIRDRPFPIVHLATHGQFSSQVNNTFILTKDGRLSIEDLKVLLESAALQRQEPLDLLVFSACETASGDRRATLGLAGMAVRAGAQSTIATLWNVNDASSALFMGDLYQTLAQNDGTKAEALQKAQVAMLHKPDYQHPYFWSPYVLIGRWQ